MAYSAAQIIQWAKICQPLARIGEAKRAANDDPAADVDLDIKLYITRKDVEYANSQVDTDAAVLFTMSNYLLSLCGKYLFQAQATTGSGGSISPITPSDAPDAYDFDVSASSFIVTGATSKTLPASWLGFNMLLIRGHITQSKVNNGIEDYYSWDNSTRILTFYGQSPSTGAAVLGENIQIYPQL